MGVTLLVAALLSQAPSTAGAGAVVGAVEVRLPAGADEKLFDRVTTLITVRRGQTLSRRAVQRSIENLWATGRFSDVVALVEDTGGEVALTIELVPRQSVTEVYVEGRHVRPASAARVPPGSAWGRSVVPAAPRFRTGDTRRRNAVVGTERTRSSRHVIVLTCSRGA